MIRTTWHIRNEDAEHTITYTLARLTGRMTVTIDGEAYRLSAGPFCLRAKARHPFRLLDKDGEPEQAVLDIASGGRAALYYRSALVEPTA